MLVTCVFGTEHKPLGALHLVNYDQWLLFSSSEWCSAYLLAGCRWHEWQRAEWQTSLCGPCTEERRAPEWAETQIWADETGSHDQIPGLSISLVLWAFSVCLLFFFFTENLFCKSLLFFFLFSQFLVSHGIAFSNHQSCSLSFLSRVHLKAMMWNMVQMFTLNWQWTHQFFVLASSLISHVGLLLLLVTI